MEKDEEAISLHLGRCLRSHRLGTDSGKEMVLFVDSQESENRNRQKKFSDIFVF